MVMPLDMILACSKHASWSRGLLAFGLPSASNKLSQPDPSEVPSALEAERVKGRGRDEMKREQVGIRETDWKRNYTFWMYPFPSGPPRTHLYSVSAGGRRGGGHLNPQWVHFMTTFVLLFVIGRDNVFPPLPHAYGHPATSLLANLLRQNWLCKLEKATKLPVVLRFFKPLTIWRFPPSNPSWFIFSVDLHISKKTSNRKLHRFELRYFLERIAVPTA